MTRFGLGMLLVLLLAGCQAKLYQHTDSVHGVSVSYPGHLSLLSEKETLAQVAETQSDAVDRPELLFVVATPGESRLSCSVHRLPEGVSMTADEYYQASTAQEIEQLGGTVVEPKSDIVLNGKTFQKVGFTAQVDEMTGLHVRIFQHLDEKSRRILVLTSMSEASAGESEQAMLDPVISSLRLDW